MSAPKCTTASHPCDVGQLPDWIPGTKAALMHKGKLVTKNKTHMLQQLPLHHAFISDSLLSPCNMIHSLLSRGMMSPSMTSIGTVFDPPLINYQKVDSSNSPSMPTTGPQCCTNKQLKTRCCFACGCLKDDIDHVL
jgi:hypothetical protein